MRCTATARGVRGCLLSCRCKHAQYYARYYAHYCGLQSGHVVDLGVQGAL